MNTMRTSSPNNSTPVPMGFTLVELLVVMGIIAILVSVAIPAANIARNKAKDTQVKAGCNTIQTALEQFAVDNSSTYPGVHWERDSLNNFYCGPGLIGGLPSRTGTEFNKDFAVPKVDIPGNDYDPYDRDPLLDDGTANPQVIDSLVTLEYLIDYPANPFLKSTGGVNAQMSNIFLWNPILGVDPPNAGNIDTLDWNRYTSAGPSAQGTESTRNNYADCSRGFFTYIPLNPVNNTGFVFTQEWTSGNLSDSQLSEYYNRCRGYMLVGWGSNRLEDRQAKGLSERLWNSRLLSIDFDQNLLIDDAEYWLNNNTTAGLLYNEMRDSSGSVGSFGQTLPGGIIDYDSAFNGAVFLIISGS